MTDMTKDGTITGLEWAAEHGEKFRFYTALDGYEPTRNYCYGDAFRYTNEQCRIGWVIDNLHPPFNGERGGLMLDFEKCNFLMDDGHTVQACYVSGWNHGGAYFFLQPFPTGFDENDEPIMRADHPDRQVDFHTWALGPRKTYHFKLRRPDA